MRLLPFLAIETMHRWLEITADRCIGRNKPQRLEFAFKEHLLRVFSAPIPKQTRHKPPKAGASSQIFTPNDELDSEHEGLSSDDKYYQ